MDVWGSGLTHSCPKDIRKQVVLVALLPTTKVLSVPLCRQVQKRESCRLIKRFVHTGASSPTLSLQFIGMCAGMPQDVAEGLHRRGGWRQKQGIKVNTKQIALDRQQAIGGPCKIGDSGRASAFQPFSGPSGLPSSPTGHPSGVSQQPDRAAAPNGQQSDAQRHGAAAWHGQLVCSQRNSNDALADVPGQEHSASGQASQSRAEGKADVHSPEGIRTGRNEAVGAVDARSLEAASDTVMAEQFGDMGGDAWKVFYMASKMGLRPDIIEKAANRLRNLQ